ncbi:MAG: glycosyltransferase family 2 protein [Patescibacteria group bacterium]
MLNNKKITVVMPAYNAAKTLVKTYEQIPHQIVDEVILVDDKSSDNTIEISKQLNIRTFVHEKNQGYGGNQKTCYQEALKLDSDIIIMLHPDNQYDPRLITAMSSLIAENIYDVVLGSRILGGKSLEGGMPFYKLVLNRLLTLIENIIIGKKLSEYHTGYRAFSKKVLQTLPILENSDDFVFDNQMLLQALFFDFKVGEISCPTRYEKDSSSINFKRSLTYGFGVLETALKYRLTKSKILPSRIFKKEGQKILAQKDAKNKL